MIYTIIALVLLVADQVVKYLVRTGIDLGQSIPFIPHLLDLTFVRNTGAAFSMLAEHTWLLILISAVVVVVVAVLTARKVFQGWLGRTAAMLVMCGGIGNLIDRVRLGYVIDFLDFHWGASHFPCFNIADSAICIGVFALIVLQWWTDAKSREQKTENSEQNARQAGDGQD